MAILALLSMFTAAAAPTATALGADAIVARASAGGTATVRILSPAMVGDGLAPPRPGMAARDSTVALPDGGTAPIRLYEFE